MTTATTTTTSTRCRRCQRGGVIRWRGRTWCSRCDGETLTGWLRKMAKRQGEGG